LQVAIPISSWPSTPLNSESRSSRGSASGLNESSSDIELIEATMGGDDNAFRHLVERFMDEVSRTVTGMMGPVPEVDDVVQEVFIKLHRSLSTYRGEASLKTFVVRMAINKSLDALRKRKRSSWLKPWSDQEALSRPSADVSDFNMTSRERRNELRRAINILPENQRAVIVLRLVEDISTEETARILDIPYGTVLSRLKRGLDKLRIELGDSVIHD